MEASTAPLPRAAKRAPLPPGPRMPRALQTIGWLSRPFQFVERARATHGDTFTMHIARDSFVVLSDPADVKQVFTGDPSVYRAGVSNIILLPFLGHKSVLLLDGAAHMSQRKLLLPPFHGEKMRRHVELMREIAEREIAEWPRGVPFQAHPHMQKVTLEVIMRIVFGVDEGDPRLAELRERLRTLLESTVSTSQLRKLLILGPESADRRLIFGRVLDPVDETIAALLPLTLPASAISSVTFRLPASDGSRSRSR